MSTDPASPTVPTTEGARHLADEDTERLVELVVRANDPMRDVPVPLPPTNAAQVRLAAQHRYCSPVNARSAHPATD